MLTPSSDGSITFQDVSFGYRRRNVLKDFDWTVQPGITALMGPNGAGKTTLLRLAAGTYTPQSGSVRVKSGDPGGRVFLLPQRFDFAPGMRAEEAVALTAWCAGVKGRDIPEAVTRGLALVDLADRARDRVRSLSGGQQQRLGLACALGTSPAVLLLDEPSVGLDPLQRTSLRDLLRELAKKVTILLSTHLVDDVAGVADNVAVLGRGRLHYDGTLTELTGSDRSIPALEAAYVALVSGERDHS